MHIPTQLISLQRLDFVYLAFGPTWCRVSIKIFAQSGNAYQRLPAVIIHFENFNGQLPIVITACLL